MVPCSINERFHRVNHDLPAYASKLTVALALALCIGCSTSSGSSGGPVTGDASDLQFVDASTDMTVGDAQTNDAMTLDAFPREEDASTSDAELPVDLGIDANR